MSKDEPRREIETRDDSCMVGDVSKIEKLILATQFETIFNIPMSMSVE